MGTTRFAVMKTMTSSTEAMEMIFSGVVQVMISYMVNPVMTPFTVEKEMIF